MLLSGNILLTSAQSYEFAFQLKEKAKERELYCALQNQAIVRKILLYKVSLINISFFVLISLCALMFFLINVQFLT